VSASTKTPVRLLIGFIRLFPIAVAVGGIWHLILVVRHLSQPIYNLRITYQGDAERAVLLVSQARFDFAKATLHARNVSLRDVRGREIASAKELSADLALPWGGRPATIVSLRGGTIDLVRLEDGSWEVMRFLPRQPEAKPSEAPFDVRAEDVRFRLVDRATAGAPVWIGTVRQASVAGYADNAAANTLIEITGVGALRATLEVRAGALSAIDVTTEAAELHELLAYAQAMPELREVVALKDVHAASARFSGTVSIWMTPEARWRVHGSFEGGDVAYQTYRASEARFEGLVNWIGIKGHFDVRRRGASATGEITANWNDSSVLARADARLPNENALRTLGIRLPKDISFTNAKFSGTLAWRNALAFSGLLRAERARLQDIEATDLQATVASDGTTVRIAKTSATIAGGTARAELVVFLEEEPRVYGFLMLSGLDLVRLPTLPEQVSRYIVAGEADAGLALSGTLTDPVVQVRASGVAEVLASGEKYVVVDHPAFSLSGVYRAGNFLIEDAHATARSGSLFANGTVSLDKRTLDLSVRGDALDLLLYPDSPVSGTAFANVQVNGTFDHPRIAGIVEAYGVEAAGVSVPIARFDADYTLGGPLDLKNIMVRQGPSEATGSLRLIETPDGWTIEGKGVFENLTLDSFIAADVAGIATGAWSVSGLVKNPDIHAVLEADALFLGELPINSVRAEGRWFGRVAYLQQFSAEFGTGTLSASGNYALSGDSSIQVNGESLDLSLLAYFLGDSISFNGSAALTGEVRFLEGAIEEASASVDVSSLALNNEPVGAGSLQARYVGDRVSASGSIGSLEGYFILDDAWYDLKTHDYAAEINVLNVPSETLYNLTQRYLPSLKPEIADLLQSTQGWLTASLSASGNAHPTPEGEARVAEHVRDGSATFELARVEARGEPIGTLRGEVRKEGRLWKILDFSWTDGPVEGRLLPSSTNTITEGGELAIEVELLNANLSVLNRLFRGSTPLSGRGDLTLEFSGPTESPHGIASLSLDELKVGDLPPIDLTLAGISILDGAIEVRAGEGAGMANLRSFAVRLEEARIPFRYPFEFPDEPIYVRVVVPERDINAASEFFGGLNTNVTVGRIHEGEALVTGTLARPEVRGAIRATAERLSFEGLDQVLHSVAASLSLEGTLTSLSVTALDNEGGSLRFEGGINLETLELLPTTFTADSFRIRQEIGDRNVMSGVINGELAASGPWREPAISGSLTAREALLALRGDFPERTAAGPQLFNPSLNVALAAERSEVRSGPLDAVFVGTGSVTGTLEQPQVRAEFRVLAGTLRLPTTDLRFTEGSRAVFTYAPQAGFEEAAQMDVALNATTRITAHNGISLQRYTVNLAITGNILSNEDLNIVATSDPPDLTRDQILAVLGQQQLLEGVAGAAVGGFNTQLADTLASVLAPVLARSLSRSLERSLGLDYLSFDIRPGSATSVTLAKALGSGFTLEYRRRLEEFEETGIPLEEVGLTYSPRLRNPILGRIRISVMAERSGILRLSVGYLRRF